MQTLNSRNRIHPTATIAESVRMGEGNVIGAYTVIEDGVEIGDGNWIGPHVTIGTPAQYTTSKFELNGGGKSDIRIGSRCVIREYCTVHQPSRYMTIVEDDCYFMAYCHVSHDTVIRRGVAMANNTQIGGFTEIQRFATIGLSAVIHQYGTIGAYAMVGMASVITKDVPPFLKVAGNPAHYSGVNEVGLQRAGFAPRVIAQILAAYGQRRLPAVEDALAIEIVSDFQARRLNSRRGCLHVG